MIYITKLFNGKKQRLQPVKASFAGNANTIDEGLDNLRNAILRQAVTDYAKALKEDTAKARREARDLEKFFLSDWGQLLSESHGELIIEMVKKKVENGAL